MMSLCNAPPKTWGITRFGWGITRLGGGITRLITPFEGFIEYLEFNTAKTDEIDEFGEVLDNIAFTYSILMIIFTEILADKRFCFKNNFVLSPHATYEYLKWYT